MPSVSFIDYVEFWKPIYAQLQSPSFKQSLRPSVQESLSTCIWDNTYLYIFTWTLSFIDLATLSIVDTTLTYEAPQNLLGNPSLAPLVNGKLDPIVPIIQEGGIRKVDFRFLKGDLINETNTITIVDQVLQQVNSNTSDQYHLIQIKHLSQTNMIREQPVC